MKRKRAEKVEVPVVKATRPKSFEIRSNNFFGSNGNLGCNLSTSKKNFEFRQKGKNTYYFSSLHDESRLTLSIFSKIECQEGRGSSLSASSSSEEDDLFYKRRRMNSNSSSSSSARKSKIILRKARLQLNQKLLKQLRQPSR